MVSSLRRAGGLVGFAVWAVACADALRLEPPTNTEAMSTQSVGGNGVGGSGGASTIACVSNSDCPEPTNICDTEKGTCVACLVLSDCGFMPGTVCSKGECVCPGGESYCGPNLCADLQTSSSHCGECKHACFGACAAGACVDPWEPVAMEGAPALRSHHVAIWTGEVMVVWGGLSSGGSPVNTGGSYDPKTFKWTATNALGAPDPRSQATAVWTGSEMIVWGGLDGDNKRLQTGGRFNPKTNTWTSVTTAFAPIARNHHTAVWTGSEMIVWGGEGPSGAELSDGSRYNPTTDAWTTIESAPNPIASRTGHCAVWDDTKKLMVLFHGFGDDPSNSTTNLYWPAGPVSAGVVYNPGGDTWSPLLPQLFEPSSRAACSAVFDGANYLVFGGFDGSNTLASGAKFDGMSWSTFAGTLPASRQGHSAVWLATAKRMAVFGGHNESGPLASGALYDPSANSWTKHLPKALSARTYHTAVATGDTMIVWGGIGPSSTLLNDGASYKP